MGAPIELTNWQKANVASLRAISFRASDIKDVVIFSVVRDLDMFHRCVSANPNNKDCAIYFFDNRDVNERVPVVYNRFLDAYDYSTASWFVLCHEDFEFLEPIGEILDDIDTDSIYGPIGGRLTPKFQWLLGGLWRSELKGEIIESAKDGSGLKRVGDCSPTGTVVDAVDCQCIVVHSDLVRRCHLRFDENLSFDLYAEDFCFGAYVNHMILTRILAIKCHHHSQGRLLPRFFSQKEYLDSKYYSAEFQGVVGYTIGGGRTPFRRLQKRLRRVMDEKCPWLVKLVFRMLPKSM